MRLYSASASASLELRAVAGKVEEEHIPRPRTVHEPGEACKDVGARRECCALALVYEQANLRIDPAGGRGTLHLKTHYIVAAENPPKQQGKQQGARSLSLPVLQSPAACIQSSAAQAEPGFLSIPRTSPNPSKPNMTSNLNYFVQFRGDSGRLNL